METNQYWGAIPVTEDRWSFALWAPTAQNVALDLGRILPLTQDECGTFRGEFGARHGMDYSFIVDGRRIADPASRRQAGPLEGPSRLVDPARLQRRLAQWQGRPFDETVISEIHIGSFTPEGTFAAAAQSPQLRQLAETGITAIELMPLGHFPGQRGWGYDVVLPWAPHPAYGTPQDLCLLVQTAHDLGLMVFLDVVFNHFGPEGCALAGISPEFFHRHSNDWGRAIDFGTAPVRDYFIGCALWWLKTYGLDGLRLDAIHAMQDDRQPGIIGALTQAIRTTDLGRPIHLMAEDSLSRAWPFDPAAGLLDARWDDERHHALHVLLTAETFGYYDAFRDRPLETLAQTLCCGSPTDDRGSDTLPPASTVAFNLNHDHAGNRPRGERLLTLVGQETALVAHALLLCTPSIPLLFMGEETGSRAPFPWFADYTGELAQIMRRERARLFSTPDAPADPMTDPFDPAVLRAACPYPAVDLSADQSAARWREETRVLLRLRRETLLPLFRSGQVGPAKVRTAGKGAIAARFPFRFGSLVAVACFFPGDHIDPGAGGEPVVAIGHPDRPPFFGLWIDPPHRGNNFP